MRVSSIRSRDKWGQSRLSMTTFKSFVSDLIYSYNHSKVDESNKLGGCRLPANQKMEDPRRSRANEYVESGNCASALLLFMELADEGDVNVFVDIASIYERGCGDVERNCEQALYWYGKAATVAQDPVGHLGLGRMLLSSHGTTREVAQSIAHLKLSSLAGNPFAMSILGLLYHQGKAK